MVPDLNCDMGEGVGHDELLMPCITSANIACGYHAGDEATMKKTVALCLKYGVHIGVHPSFPDRENFGRTEMAITTEAVKKIVKDQIELLAAIASSYGAKLHHVKPHGALYNMAARDVQLAIAIVQAVKETDASLVLYGLSGSYLVTEAARYGISAWNEVFADRTYSDDGSLTPRSKQNALIQTSETCVQQVMQMIQEGKVTATSGKKIPVVADTVCIHGDGPHAVAFARAVQQAISNA